MQYLLLIYGDEQAWGSMSKEEMENIYAGHKAYGQEMSEAGVIRGGAELQPTAAAQSVRFETGKPHGTTDGPFAETKEQLAGYYLIDVETPEQAVEWAKKMPGMTRGTVEVRPLATGS